MSSANDYVKYITQQVVSYMDKPKEMKKQTKMQRKMEKQPVLNRWFGIIPLSVKMYMKKKQK